MEIEEEQQPSEEYTFGLADGSTIRIPGEIVKQLLILQTMIDECPSEIKELPIPLMDLITRPIMQWIVDAYTIYDVRKRSVIDLDDLYKDIEFHNKLGSLHYPKYVPLLTLFGDGVVPTIKDFEVLFVLANTLNWLDADRLLFFVLKKIYSLLATMTTEEIESLESDISSKKRKQEETGQLPLVPYYNREEIIREYLGQFLSPDLIHANASNDKYINPIVAEIYRQLFLTTKGLYAYSHGSQLNLQEQEIYPPQKKIIAMPDIPGVILLVIPGRDFILCLTTMGLYGYGRNHRGQLGLGEKNDYFRNWTKIEIPGEVLLISAGDNHSMVLTTTGLYVSGENEDGQLGIGDTKRRYQFTLNNNVNGTIRSLSCAFNNTFILTNTGLYACGRNVRNQMDIEKGRVGPMIHLTSVIGLVGQVLSVSSCPFYTMIVTTDGLYYMGNLPYQMLNIEKTEKIGSVKKIDTILIGIPLSVYVGWSYSVVLTKTGDLYAIGSNDLGQLSVGDNRPRLEYTKMLGVEGDIKNVTCLPEYIIILTTTGVYVSGYLSLLENLYTEYPYLVRFTKIDIEMGYFPHDNESEPPTKQRKLQCVHCHGIAQFFAQQQDINKLPFCSKYCLLDKKYQTLI